MSPPFDSIAAAIEQHQNFVLVAHVGPDGDAIGSGLALRLALSALGKRAWFVGSDGVPSSCRFLPEWKSVVATAPGKEHCTFILDCDGTPVRVAAPYELIERATQRVLIDHHRTSQPIFDVNWIDPEQPATALMIFQLLRHMQWPITKEIAQCLLCGLSTDTGNFRFPNTTPACLAAASELVAAGADPALVAFKLFDERSLDSTRLLGVALQKVQAEEDGQLTWTALAASDFATAGTGDESSENVVNFLRSVRGSRMAVILRERTDETGPVARISVRCEPEMRADLFCGQFGGGGHAAAAGCRIRHQPFEQSVKVVVEAAKRWLHQEHSPISGE